MIRIIGGIVLTIIGICSAGLMTALWVPGVVLVVWGAFKPLTGNDWF